MFSDVTETRRAAGLVLSDCELDESWADSQLPWREGDGEGTGVDDCNELGCGVLDRVCRRQDLVFRRFPRALETLTLGIESLIVGSIVDRGTAKPAANAALLGKIVCRLCSQNPTGQLGRVQLQEGSVDLRR